LNDEYTEGDIAMDDILTLPDKDLIELIEAIMDEYDEAFVELGQ